MTGWSIVGTISGTSADGIDLAEIETDGQTVSRFGPATTTGYRSDTRRMVLEAAGRKGENRDTWPEIAEEVTADHAAAIGDFLQEHHLTPDAIVFHGQTVWHDPKKGETVQLGDPQVLAKVLGLPVIGDVRACRHGSRRRGCTACADLSPGTRQNAGRHGQETLCFLNIGGVSNLTFISGDHLLAFDIGPGNALLDDWIRVHGAGDYDAGGVISAKGHADEKRLTEALKHPFLSGPGPKSLDRYSFSADFVEGMSLGDGAATLLTFTAEAIAKAETLLPQKPGLWLVCGGGRHNPVLMQALRDRLAGDVVSADDYGIDGDALEAQAMAFLGARLKAGLPTTFPETTGVGEPAVGGKVYLPAL
ncbi:anhydro-N-acetylmuramic acid kinase [Labrenzia sp. DG1229]|uniref:anhydro-N-acetylmuramic acid kinase n=1 Tax=Labrenzia sp. DG1229 TaxID=681847 RepID=UPI000A0669EB|nr:anhydro-N-acetylmuramic acid kinase [Labrenzia sp. DG1229]